MGRLGSPSNPLVLQAESPERAAEILGICEERGWKAVIRINPDEPEDLGDLRLKLDPPTVVNQGLKLGRNDPCNCGSGKKFKKCCAVLDCLAQAAF